MKTKEIKVWVSMSAEDTVLDILYYAHPLYEKATLVIEIPEKIIELTESKFSEHYYTIFGTNESMLYKRLKERLGF